MTDKKGDKVTVDALDVAVTKWSDQPGLALAVVNKDPAQKHSLTLSFCMPKGKVKMYTVSGDSTESYNDINHEEVSIKETDWGDFEEEMEIVLSAHSVNVIQII